MPFFIKSNKRKSFSKSSSSAQRKRKTETTALDNNEITSSEDEHNGDDFIAEVSSSEGEHEATQDKKLRLAKLYLEEIEKEERKRLEDKEFSKEILSERLKKDHLKQVGKYVIKIGENYAGVHENHIQMLKCKELKSAVTCLCTSSDDKWVFSGDKSGVVIKWSMEESRKIEIIPSIKSSSEQNKGHTGCIHSIAVSMDHKFLAVGDSSSRIQIWDPATLVHIGTLKGHKQPVTGLCVKHNSHTLFSASGDKTIRVWSLDEMTFIETLFGHQDQVTSVDILNSDQLVSSGGRDGTVRLWKVNEESQLIFNAHPDNVDCVKLINQKHFVTGGDKGQISVWTCLKKKPLCSVTAAHGLNPNNSQPFWVTAVASYTHSDVIASGSQDGYIRLWRIDDKYRKITKLFDIPVTGFVNTLMFSSDGKKLIAGVGKEYRLGRWSTVKEARNCVYVIPLQVMD